MKYVLPFLMFVLFAIAANAQRIVFHSDLFARTVENTAYKQISLNEYNKKMDSVKSLKQQVLGYWTTIYQVNQRILDNLRNVDDAIKQGKTLADITVKASKIFKVIADAGAEAAGKPYLIVFYNSTADVLVGKVVELQSYVSKFISSHDNDQILINQATRDEFLWTVFGRINTILNLSNSMLSLFRQYNFQAAINKVVPYSYFISLDKSIAQNLLTQLKFFP